MKQKIRTAVFASLLSCLYSIGYSQPSSMKPLTTIQLKDFAFSKEDRLKASVYNNYLVLFRANNKLSVFDLSNSEFSFNYATNNSDLISGFTIIKKELFIIQSGNFITINLDSGNVISSVHIPEWKKDQEFYSDLDSEFNHKGPIAVLPNGIIAFGSLGGNFFKGWSGNVFRYDTEKKIFLDTIAANKGVGNPISYNNNMLYFGYRSSVQAMDPITGKLLWSSELDKNQHQSMPVFHNDLIIIQNGEAPQSSGTGIHASGSFGDGYLNIMDSKTGSLKWKVKINNYGNPVIQGNCIATTSWKLFGGRRFKGFDLNSGKELWDYSKLKSEKLIAAGGHFYVDAGNGNVHELSPETGVISGVIKSSGYLLDLATPKLSTIATVVSKNNDTYINFFQVPDKTLKGELIIPNTPEFKHIFDKGILILIKSASPNNLDASITLYAIPQ